MAHVEKFSIALSLKWRRLFANASKAANMPIVAR